MKRILFSLFASGLLLAPTTVMLAQDYTGQLDNTGQAVYDSPDNQNFFVILGTLLNALLSFLGVVLLILIIYGGFLWMTAAGNEKQVGKAKDILLNAAIGLVILLTSYAISRFVVEQLSTVVNS